jgi:hypothetical protein
MEFIFRVIIAASLVLSFARNGRAANEIQPGLWLETETGDVNGRPPPPKVTTDCVKPEGAKDPAKMIQGDAEGRAAMQQARCPDQRQRHFV